MTIHKILRYWIFKNFIIFVIHNRLMTKVILFFVVKITDFTIRYERRLALSNFKWGSKIIIKVTLRMLILR
jgi:hypothetical protein